LFQAELGWIGQVLVLAAAALAEVLAERFDPFRRGSNNVEEFGPRESLLHVGNLCLHDFARRYEWDENNKIIQSRHSFSPEGNIIHPQGQFVTPSQTHFAQC
jgi:hypothetical protein